MARTKSSKKSSVVPPTSSRSSTRKRTQSSSIRSTQRSSKKTKSASASSRTPDLRSKSPSLAQEETSTLGNIIDLEEPLDNQENLEIAAEDGAEDSDTEEDIAEEGVAEEGVVEEGVVEEGIAEESNAEEGNAEEGDAEEDSIIEEEPPMKFMSTLRAVSGKEHLPGVQSREYEQWELRMSLLERWREGDLLPGEFRVVRFEAVGSYDRCRASEERPQALRRSSDLYSILDVLKSWHQRWPRKQLSLPVTLYLEEKKEEIVTTRGQQTIRPGRRTVTQAQLVTLPEVLQAEASSGNAMPAIADRWTCHNLSCRNKGKTC